ncbi:hypothetical protein AJ79_01735 [Helicocarpus griseus UAMH5409]|uniref:Mid2 domain-containing protein n=1 Tax=Helicocarpus griseus UAMH5409 TaxID=1447875 RepID=A0A2B7XXA1_9EURO|nr:hypothetical protein AJ79_01735 [Helicocarpus griseus UAMH5409]
MRTGLILFAATLAIIEAQVPTANLSVPGSDVLYSVSWITMLVPNATSRLIGLCGDPATTFTIWSSKTESSLLSTSASPSTTTIPTSELLTNRPLASKSLTTGLVITTFSTSIPSVTASSSALVPNTESSLTTFHNNTNIHNDNNNPNKRGGLSTGSKAALGITIPVAALISMIACFWLRRRRKKTALSSSETQCTEDQENKPAVHEISGLEISGSDGRCGITAELDTVDTRIQGENRLPAPNNGSRLPLWQTDSVPLQNNAVQQVAELGAGAVAATEHAVTVNHGVTSSSPQISEPMPESSPNRNSSSPTVPSSHQVFPISTSATISPASQRISFAESPVLTTTEQDSEIRGLLLDLEEVERWRGERATRLQMLVEEENAIQAEEQAILDKIRKKTKSPPRSGPS